MSIPLIKCFFISIKSNNFYQSYIVGLHYNMFVIKRTSKSYLILPKVLNFINVSQIHSQRMLFKNNNEYLNVKIREETLKFPYVWLRDNCQCEKCFHPSAKSRTIDWANFDVDVKPRSVNVTSNSIKIIWDDNHESNFGLNWLEFRSFTAENQQKYAETIYRPSKITWKGDEFDKICTRHDFKEIVNSNTALYNWLHNLSVYGVALIQSTPNSETALDRIVEKIGFTKRTHYGVKFIVQHVNNTSNVAYLSNNLPMHVDLPYYEYCPGVNLLHCLEQTKSKGGENLLSDGHYVAHYMKENYPQEYKVLTDTEVEWSDVGIEHGNEFYKLNRSPVICLNKHKEITRVNFSTPQRGSQFPGPIETVKPWYKAHQLFFELNHKFSAKFKTKPGDILVFDNIRLLHGRNAYEDQERNIRKLIGAYVDWDEIYSRLRCLKVKLDDEDNVY